MGSPDWNVSVVDIHLQKLMWVCCPGHTRAKRNDWADLYTGTSGGQSNPHKWLASQKIWNIEKLETLPVEHKAKDITPSIAWRREVWIARRSSLKGWESAIVNQMNIGTISKAMLLLGELLRDRVECTYGLSQVHRYHLLLTKKAFEEIRPPSSLISSGYRSLTCTAVTFTLVWLAFHLHPLEGTFRPCPTLPGSFSFCNYKTRYGRGLQTCWSPEQLQPIRMSQLTLYAKTQRAPTMFASQAKA